jgi:hypothetical protein
VTTPMPSLRALTKSLRQLHEAFSHPMGGGEYVSLVDAGSYVGFVIEGGDHPDGTGHEWVPGDGLPFDAVAAARRLLSDVNRARALSAKVSASVRRDLP